MQSRPQQDLSGDKKDNLGLTGGWEASDVWMGCSGQGESQERLQLHEVWTKVRADIKYGEAGEHRAVTTGEEDFWKVVLRVHERGTDMG